MQFGHFKCELIVVEDIGFVQFVEITVWQRKKIETLNCYGIEAGEAQNDVTHLAGEKQIFI